MDAAAALELIMLLEREHAAYRDREAIAWTVVCVDDEEGLLPFTAGLFPDERSATELAAHLDAEDRKWETEGWRHEVVPIFPSGVEGAL
jgi:hypothetical protein